MKKVKNILRNEKGLTLIELLAVVVILGIIAAIAIPAIGSVIENTKKDAHRANAQQILNAANLAIAAGDLGDVTTASLNATAGATGTTGTAGVLDDYLESLVDPDSEGDQYNTATITVAGGKVTGINLVGDKYTLSISGTVTGSEIEESEPTVTSGSGG